MIWSCRLLSAGIWIGALAAGYGNGTSTLNDAAPDRPNVLIIYTDDQGTFDLGCYGSSDLATPNLDRLASEGVRFTHMYAPSAICSASRAGLLTGRLPVRAGVPGNVSSMQGKPGMPSEEVTIAEMLRGAGYATGHVGKWHLGYTPGTMPNGQGFDSSFGHMGGCIDNYSHYFYWNGPNRHDLWRNGREVWEEGRYFGDLMVREVKAFIDGHRTEPFFLYWAINMPHYPLQGTAKWRDYYRDLASPRNKYNAFVSTMDEMVGQVLQYLDQLNLRESTLIIFQSDHGHSVEERAFFGGGNAGNLRGAKGCLFEGGIRVPAIVSQPGSLPESEVRSQLAVGWDWMPTIAELCGVPLPDRTLDGRSLVPVIKSAEAPSPHDIIYWHLGRGAQAQWAIRSGPWKLLGNPRDTTKMAPLGNDDRLFLVNLEEHPDEMVNQAEIYPEILDRLVARRFDFIVDLGLQ